MFNSAKLFAVVFSLFLQFLQEGATKGTHHSAASHDDRCTPNYISSQNVPKHQLSEISGQLILPNHTFECSAVITEWEVTVPMQHHPASIEFQVWRLEPNDLEHYRLVGKNTYRSNSRSLRDHDQQLTLSISETSEQIRVRPKDVIGIYTGGGDKVAYHSRADVWTYHTSQHLEDLSPKLNVLRSSIYRPNGAPLVHATVEESEDVIDPSPVVPKSVDAIETTTAPLSIQYHNKSTTVHPTLFPPSNRRGYNTTWWEQNKLVIGVAVCGCVLVLLCVALVVVVVIYTRARQRQRDVHSQQDPHTVAVENQSSFFSHLPLDTIGRKNFFAFKRRHTAADRDIRHTGVPQPLNTRELLRMNAKLCAERRQQQESTAYEEYEFIRSTPALSGAQAEHLTASLEVSMKENPSYSMLAEGADSPDGSPTAIEENVYDVPIITHRPQGPREYEVPVASLERSAVNELIGVPNHVYEDPDCV